MRLFAALLLVAGLGAAESPARAVSLERITAAATAAITAGEGAEFGPITVSGPLEVREAGEVTLQAEPLTKAGSGRIPVRVRALVANREVGRILATVPVRVLRTASVLAVPVTKGTVIGLEHLRQDRVEVLPGVTDLLAGPEDAVGRVALRDLSAGTPLRGGFFQLPALIKPGPVTLLFRAEGIELSGTGEAIASGRLGEVVQIRRPDGRVIRAQVVGQALALVNY